MKQKTFKITAAQSSIDWEGRKVTGAHNGTINFKDGELTLDTGTVINGKFIVSMNTIKILDITDPATNAQFAGHLASDDFFSTDKYPEAILELVSVTPNSNSDYRVNGKLTIKGITHPVSFLATLKVNDDVLHAKGKIIINRTLYGIKFRSGNFFKDLGDTLIYDEFDLNFSIIAKAEPVLA